ncbi:type IV secretion system protein VirB4 [Alkalihalobacillus hwajinpoensis]|uniref:VirB4 family type IV secretion system protein n=1 Tax=Guptibacillus hwajinpoensis TaxID=208199 RepID=UPI0018834A7E|nr:type IV secretion system protein VirB4 [Pseudalkalibacillus hwajinpoensis]MBF0706015.1 type IV secretion system protein VirB4 [Pseudalkalibacillus hwajinpoensis]
MFKFASKSSEHLKTKSIGYNPYLLARIQPQGGMRFQESFIRKGDGYEVCVHVYSFPKSVSDFWLEPIFNMEHVITTMDVISDDRLKVRDGLNKGMAEQSSRIMNERDNAGIIEAQNNYDDLKELYNQVSEEGEVVKRIHLRLYVSAPTKAELEDKVKVVLSTLQDENFRGSIFLNEQEYEWKALLSNYSAQFHYLNKREGQPIPTIGLAGGFPFHFTSLNDPYGTFYGTTMTGGNVLFDLFHRDHQRKSFNGVMVGAMGAGKSTFLKKIMLDNAIKGYKVRTFDVTGEFAELTEALGGKQIALDGSDGVINPLQVYRTAEDEYTSFTQHLSKLTTFYKFLAPEAKDSELKEYENLLRKLYGKLGLWKEEEESNITKQSVQEYPIFSDFLTFVEEQLYENTNEGKQRENVSLERRRRLENIELNIRNIVETYAHLFNGVSTMEHFDSQQVVTFTLRGLSQMRAEVFQAQLFNVLNLLWDSMLTNGAPQFEAYDRGELAFEDAVRYLILMDEAHHIINTKKKSESALDFLTKFSREARKYFGGLLYASHTIRDFVPEGSDQSMVEEIKKLFELTQYKIIMQQDSNNLEMMQQIFTGQLSQSELQDIPYLQTGETMLSIRAVENIRFKVEVSDEELALFGGGA